MVWAYQHRLNPVNSEPISPRTHHNCAGIPDSLVPRIVNCVLEGSG